MPIKFVSNIILLTALALLLIYFNLFIGNISLSILTISEGSNYTIFYDIRLPKTITAIFAGGGLAIAGLLMQTLFRNQLAGPYVLGISSGASLGVAIALIVFGGVTSWLIGKALISLAAIVGGLLVMVFILIVAKRTKSNTTVLLVGIMFSQILSAVQGIIEYISNPVSLKSFIVWGMGTVSNTTVNDLIYFVPIVLGCIVITIFLSKDLNAILLNESYAHNLGVNVKRLRVQLILLSALITGIITAFCGPIAFIGLSVPIASRLLFKSSHSFHQIIYCFLLGVITLLGCDSICQLLSRAYLLPINTMTTLVGSPVVIYLLFKSRTIS